MPACFSTLPPEISTQIISNVKKSGWLLDLAVCCRSLYQLTLPYLYSDVKLLVKNYETGFPLKSFTIHILKNPGLGSHVRGFAIDDWWGDVDYSSDDLGSQGIDETVQKVVSTSNLSQKEQKKWTEFLQSGDDDAYVALLLSLLPNLERLDLVVAALFADCFEKLFQKAARKERLFHIQPAFASLRVVVNKCNDEKYWTTPRLLSDYLQLPSIREFYGQMIGSYDDEAHEGLATLEAATLPLVHLELRESKLNTIDVTNLLRALKHLQTFVYELGWELNLYSNYSTPDLGKALSWTENTLENLWLDYAWANSYIPGEDFSPISTLSRFKVLKNIRVGMYVFFGEEEVGSTWVGADGQGHAPDLASLMPASIETLYFSHTEGRLRVLISALENLLQIKESSTPKLRRIAFEADIGGEDNAFDWAPLSSLAEEAGVEIVKVDGKGKERGRGKDGSLTWAGEGTAEWEHVYLDVRE